MSGSSHIPKFLRLSLLIAAIAVSFLFSPKPKDPLDLCGHYIHLNAYAGFTFNCDADEYSTNAKDPSKIFYTAQARQSRPLYLIIAGAIGRPVQWVLDKIPIPFIHNRSDYAATYAGYYIAYVILNYLLLLLSLYFFEAIIFTVLGANVNRWLLLAFEILLVSNQVTKAFFWTAHQQFFALFTPLFTIWLALRVADKGIEMRKMGMLSLMCGILMLAYGNFIPMFLCLLWASYMVNKKIDLPGLLMNGVLFALPTLLWIGYCTYTNGHYYNLEVARFREIVWIVDALKVSFTHFLSVSYEYFIAYLKTYREIIIFIAIAITLYFMQRQIKDKNTDAFLKLSLVTFFLFFLFFYAVGHYVERISYATYPVVLCVLIVCVQKALPKVKPAIFLLFALGWHLYNMLSYGPFS